MRKAFRLVLAILFLTSVGIYALDNMLTNNVSVGVDATQIADSNYKRKEITITNVGSTSVFIDNSLTDCTTGSYELEPDKSVILEFQGEVWGIVDVTTSTVSTYELQY